MNEKEKAELIHAVLSLVIQLAPETVIKGETHLYCDVSALDIAFGVFGWPDPIPMSRVQKQVDDNIKLLNRLDRRLVIALRCLRRGCLPAAFKPGITQESR